MTAGIYVNWRQWGAKWIINSLCSSRIWKTVSTDTVSLKIPISLYLRVPKLTLPDYFVFLTEWCFQGHCSPGNNHKQECCSRNLILLFFHQITIKKHWSLIKKRKQSISSQLLLRESPSIWDMLINAPVDHKWIPVLCDNAVENLFTHKLWS